MKKLFIIICVLAVTSLIVWKISSRKSEAVIPTAQEQNPTETTRSGLKPLSSRANRAAPSSAVAQTDDALTTNETLGMPLTQYLALVRSHYDGGGEPRMAPGLAMSNLPAFLPRGQTPEEIQATRERVRAAREQWRQELREKDEYKAMFAKEDEWKEKSKSIATGMTLQEVIAVMGTPTRVETFVETGKDTVESVIVPINTLPNIKIMDMAFVYYSPDGEPPLMDGTIGQRLSRLPFDHLLLNFDNGGKLTFITWDEEGLAASISRSAEQGLGVERH